MYTAVDIFGGCGGLTTGLEAAGFDVVGAVEIDHNAKFVYELNHPGVTLFEDVRLLTSEIVLKTLGMEPGQLSLMAACPPCQGFSRMRTKNRVTPVDDERNDLVLDVARLIEGVLPATVMIENVPALRNDARFDETVERLECAGYHWSCEIVDAAHYNVPQRRKRMILMASRLGPVEIPEGGSKRRTVRETIEALPAPDTSHKPLHRLLGKHNEKVRDRIARVPHDGGSRSAWGDDEQLDCHKKMSGFKDVYGRMKWDDVAPTITRYCTNPSKGRFLHPEQDREITLFEASLLQSFPRSYKFPVTLGRGAIASMIGEALPPRMAEHHAAYLREHLETNNWNN
jgi:DNA (cytosine-5)-methyltransferase 1